jgi:hypothetical protein
MTRDRWIGVGVAAAVSVSAVVVGSGPAGLLYLLAYVAIALPGIPLGLWLFGRDNAVGWIAGLLFGYSVAAFAAWCVIASGVPRTIAFLLAWAVLSVVAWGLYLRRRPRLIVLPPWTSGATAGLALVLLLTLALAVPPLARLGANDQHGNRYYRAYFTADFFWHTALTAELTKFTMPPRNPYLASEPIHYYWTYFLIPAVLAEKGPAPLRDVQLCLKLNAVCSGLLLMASIFVLAWTAVRGVVAVTTAVVLALMSASLEGTYELYRLWLRGRGFSELRDTNIDAITAWLFQGHRIDGLPRCLWYVPQHSMAYALGLIALTAAAAGGTPSIAAIVLSGLALGCASALNPFVGGLFALSWGLAIALTSVREPAPGSRIARHALAAVPVALAIAWCVASRMVEGAGGVLEIGWAGASSHAPAWSLFLSLGPVLLLVLGGCLTWRLDGFSRVVPAVSLACVSLVVMYLVRLRVDQEWVPFRAGQMFLVAAPTLGARWLAGMEVTRGRRRLAIACVLLLFVAGLPTTTIDAFNARDIGNSHIGAGFHWTAVLPPEEAQAFAWIRRATPRSAIVQMEPTVRDRESSPGNWGEWWSIVPTFGERRMAAGLPISLMRIPEYRQKSEMVKTIFDTADVHAAWTVARELHIDYLYVDALDRQTYAGAEKFDTPQQFFKTMFKRGAVGVYQVR